jgi:hypothetical protein
VSVKVQLLQKNSPVIHNVVTPSGRVTLTLTFCSPEKQQSIIIRPTKEGGRPMGENPVKCQPEQAIPADFMDLPEAVQQARDRGMKAEYPREARLKNRTSGVRGEDIFGVVWHIFSPNRSDQSYLIPMQA